MAMLQNQAISADKIQRLEAWMRELPQVTLPIEHEFCNGLYARTMRLPAGTLATGHFHKNENFTVVRSGSLKLWTGYEALSANAGDMVVSPTGAKRVAYAITDVVLTTFHPNPDNVRDPETLWEMYVTDDPAQVTYEISLLIEDNML